MFEIISGFLFAISLFLGAVFVIVGWGIMRANRKVLEQAQRRRESMSDGLVGNISANKDGVRDGLYDAGIVFDRRKKIWKGQAKAGPHVINEILRLW